MNNKDQYKQWIKLVESSMTLEPVKNLPPPADECGCREWDCETCFPQDDVTVVQPVSIAQPDPESEALAKQYDDDIFFQNSGTEFDEAEKPKKKEVDWANPSFDDFDDIGNILGGPSANPIIPHSEPEQPHHDEPGEKPAFELPKSSAANTRAKTAAINPSNNMRDMMNRVQGFDDEMDDAEAAQHAGLNREEITDLVPTTVKIGDIPAVISTAMQAAGTVSPEWHNISNLPGYMQRNIRGMGRQIFSMFTATPMEKIQTIANVEGQGPNTTAEINAVANFLRENAEDLGEFQVNHGNAIPGYRPDVKEYRINGIRFHVVRDPMGQYIYAYPEKDARTHQNPQRLGNDVPRPRLREGVAESLKASIDNFIAKVSKVPELKDLIGSANSHRDELIDIFKNSDNLSELKTGIKNISLQLDNSVVNEGFTSLAQSVISSLLSMGLIILSRSFDVYHRLNISVGHMSDTGASGPQAISNTIGLGFIGVFLPLICALMAYAHYRDYKNSKGLEENEMLLYRPTITEQIQWDQELLEAFIAESSLSRMVGKRPGGQKLVHWLHSKHKLSNDANYEEHPFNQRVLFKEFKRHPDNFLIVVGTKGVAAIKPYEKQIKDNMEAARRKGRDYDPGGDSTLKYQIIAYTSDGARVDPSTLRQPDDKEHEVDPTVMHARGGIPGKKDKQTDNNIFQLLSQQIGTLQAVYIATGAIERDKIAQRADMKKDVGGPEDMDAVNAIFKRVRPILKKIIAQSVSHIQRQMERFISGGNFEGAQKLATTGNKLNQLAAGLDTTQDINLVRGGNIISRAIEKALVKASGSNGVYSQEYKNFVKQAASGNAAALAPVLDALRETLVNLSDVN